MLETIREYALEQLEELDEAAITRQEHATYYLGLAELAELNLQGKEQVMWLQRLNGDHENFRAALEWASHHGQYEMVARIAGALHHFWNVCSHLSDGSYWLKAALAHRDILSAAQSQMNEVITFNKVVIDTKLSVRFCKSLLRNECLRKTFDESSV